MMSLPHQFEFVVFLMNNFSSVLFDRRKMYYFIYRINIGVKKLLGLVEMSLQVGRLALKGRPII